MIKNIVFDMGKVLVDYEGHKVGTVFIEDERERKEVCTSVFDSQEWLLLDMGLISEEDALQRMQSRLTTDHAKEMAELCLKHWHEYNMKPVKEMGELVRELKEQGYGIYLCSNASLRLLTCRDIIPGIEYFDGVLFSAEVKCMKPQKEMYEHLFERFHLNPRECFFIDDLLMNVEGARACGMEGYCFADRNIEGLKECLSKLNEA
ncbi:MULTISPECIES: HAD family phosphatase [Lacrimispora]|jgi:putative hydrolase of the HAD superfamily|uniref:HAD family hydrolase n=1 Tax=Lacrimispora TaxID=2719231 RepID=UPI000BE3E1C7|nr:HAD family phosphatase [Lacrimispora amygdalina]MDK2966680.1 putative hydrolase of the superfamily [Lacrimispora sp.]